MGEFYAWAITGQIIRLEVWSDPDDRSDPHAPADSAPSVLISSQMAEQQRFVLRNREGQETSVHLIDSGVILRNSDIVTLVWAASEGSTIGQCIYIENHTIGMKKRLEQIIRQIRPPVSQSKVLGYGALATIPALIALLAWFSSPSTLFQMEPTTFLAATAIALALLFAVGAIVSRLVFEYLRSEDEARIWEAVTRALRVERRPRSLSQRLSQPMSGSEPPRSATRFGP